MQSELGTRKQKYHLPCICREDWTGTMSLLSLRFMSCSLKHTRGRALLAPSSAKVEGPGCSRRRCEGKGCVYMTQRTVGLIPCWMYISWGRRVLCLVHPEPSLAHRRSSVNICQMSDSQMSNWAGPSNEVVASLWNPVENKSGVRLGACPKVTCCPITPWYSFIHLFIHSWNIYLFCNILSNSHWGTKMNVNQYCLIPSLSGAPGIPWWLRLGPHPWEETRSVQTTDGEHLTPPGNRAAGKSFSEVGTCGLHLDGRVGICEAGARPGGVLKVWRSGISQSQAEATLQPYFLTPSFLTTQTHWQYLFFFLTPSSFTPSQAHPRAWLHSKCTAQM